MMIRLLHAVLAVSLRNRIGVMPKIYVLNSRRIRTSMCVEMLFWASATLPDGLDT
jgi:hypothetical protein